MSYELDPESEFRRELEEKTQSMPKLLKHLPSGVELVTPPYQGQNCETYALGTSGIRNVLSGLYADISNPQEGDIVLYHSEENGVVHVGIYQKDGTVMSKWGNMGPVLRHPVDHVPSSYGDTVMFRRIPKKDLEDMRGKDVFDFISFP